MNLYSIQIYWSYRSAGESRECVDKLLRYLDALRCVHRSCSEWYLQGKSIETAFSSRVQTADSLLSELNRRNVARIDSSFGIVLGLWNGRKDEYGISLRLVDGWLEGQVKNGLFIQLPPLRSHCEDLINREVLIKLITAAIPLWSPYWASILPFGYEESESFCSSKRGVGWVAYSSVIVDHCSLEDIRGIQVDHLSDNLGTIISATEEPFTCDNPEHLERSNKIEKILAFQGLLPNV